MNITRQIALLLLGLAFTSSANAQLGQSATAASSQPAGPTLEETQAWVLGKIPEINRAALESSTDHQYFAEFSGCTFKLLRYKNKRYELDYQVVDLKDLDPINPIVTLGKVDAVARYRLPTSISYDGTDPPGFLPSDNMLGVAIWQSPTPENINRAISKLTMRPPRSFYFLEMFGPSFPEGLRPRVLSAFSHMSELCSAVAAAKARKASQRAPGEVF